MTMWLEESYLFTGSLDGHVKVWDASGNQVYDQACCQPLIKCVAFAVTRATLSPGREHRTSHLCAVQQWVGERCSPVVASRAQAVTNQNNQPSGVTAILVLPEPSVHGGESSVLVTACDDKALKLWMMPTFDKRGIIAPRAGHSDVVRCIARGPGNSFFSGAMDNSIIVWEFMSQ